MIESHQPAVPMFEDVPLVELFGYMRSLSGSPYIQALMFLIIFDIFTGYVKLIKTKRFNSSLGTRGLLMHGFVFMVVLVVATYARALGYRPIGIAWVMFFNLNYIGSILENWEEIDIFFPAFLKPWVNTLRKQHEDKIKKQIQKEKNE